MTDREDELRELTAQLREYDVVSDAFLAKSFTDRLVVVDLQDTETVPPRIEDLLGEHGLRGANEVYADSDTDVSFAGAVGTATRHQFVDVRTRGDHQSYTVE